MYQSLQSSRAIAAILVLLYHLGGTISSEKYFNIKGFYTPFSFGASGVDFFFVLSGFIIYYAHKKDIGKPRTLLTYLYKRVTRIYPIYFIIFIGVYVLAYITPQLHNTVPHDFHTLIKSILLFPQDKNILDGTGAPVLMVAWTLQFEMLFYLMFTLGIINRRLGQAVIVLFISLFFYLPETNTFPLEFLMNDYIWLFLMGMFSAKMVTENRLGLKYAFILAIYGGVICLFAAFDVITESNNLGNVKIIINGIGYSFIVVALTTYEQNGKVFLKHKYFQLLGASSYALYLIHVPLISILSKLSLLLGAQAVGFWGALITYIIIFTVCIFVSIAFHLIVEKPMTKKLGLFIVNKSII